MAIVFVGTEADEEFTGTNGVDYLYGYYGNDRLFGLGGTDILRGSFGTDYLDGGDGSDGISGNDDDDTIFGGNGLDIIRGDDGQDTIDGGGGDDIISGGFGGDTLTGGEGADIFVYATGKNSIARRVDVITDFNPAEDRIDLSGIDADTGTSGGQDIVFVGAAAASTPQVAVTPTAIASLAGLISARFLAAFGGEPEPSSPPPVGSFDTGQVRARVADGHTYVELNTDGDAAPEMVIDLLGEHTLTAANFITAGNDNSDDSIANIIIGDGGFEHEDDGTLIPLEPPEVDVDDAGGGEDYLYGAFDNDILSGGGDIDFVRGGADDDTLDGGESYDILDGGDGNDTLLGGDGTFTDLLRGTEGDDLLDGQGGDDVLDGGDGSDVFRFVGDFGDDQIVDFRSGIDTLQIDVDGIDGVEDLSASGNAVIVSGGGTITFENGASSTATDFVFL